MNLHDSYFADDVEHDIKFFASNETRKRDPKINGVTSQTNNVPKITNMGFEEQSSPSTTPERNVRQRQVKSTPAVELYRPPAARRASQCSTPNLATEQAEQVPLENSAKSTRQKRPDRAVYIVRGRRSNPEPETSPKTPKSRVPPSYPKFLQETFREFDKNVECEIERKESSDLGDLLEKTLIQSAPETNQVTPKQCTPKTEEKEESPEIAKLSPTIKTMNERNIDVKCLECDATEVKSNAPVLKISDECQMVEEILEVKVSEAVSTQEGNTQKIEKGKSKNIAAPRADQQSNIKRDEADWESLFDENGECLDQSLIDELSSAVGEVMIEQPKSTYQAPKRPVEVLTGEFAHVIEIYNFPSEFKTCDLGVIFNPYRNAGFELKWVDDTHCLGVCGSPLIAAEVLAADHPFVKTRPFSEATALSKNKAKQSPDCLKIRKARPETCAALARRLVTGALGVRLATATQEREREKVILREAKERRRLANKQKDDIWEGVFPEK